MKRAAWAALLASLLAPACHHAESRGPEVKGSFGVLFGGQIQERRDVPFELDPTKQTLVFRIDWTEPLTTDTAVEWQLERPSPHKAEKRRGSGTPQQPPVSGDRGTAVLRAGETRLERTVTFRPGDPLGLWNIRVVEGGRVVIDRPFEVYDPVARDRAARSDGGAEKP